jgi:dTDP-L-rhamnose 4-epimerase
MIALNLGRRYDLPTTCLRYSIVQGKRQSFRNAYSGILRNFTQRLLAGQSPVCYEDGLQVRDYVYVGDVARANLLVLEDPRADFEVYNVGGTRPVRVLEYAQLLGRKINARVEPRVPGLYRSGDTRHIISDGAKLQALGWAPTKQVEAIADEYIEWAAGQPNLRDYYAEAEAGMLARGSLRATSA